MYFLDFSTYGLVIKVKYLLGLSATRSSPEVFEWFWVIKRQRTAEVKVNFLTIVARPDDTSASL